MLIRPCISVWPSRTLGHPNVATFYGCLLNVVEQAFLYEHCFRGTLHDVLLDLELELDWVFKLSFALDIVEGMKYLHSRKVIHGRLNVKSCLVSQQWTLKIHGKSVIWGGLQEGWPLKFYILVVPFFHHCILYFLPCSFFHLFVLLFRAPTIF